MKRILLSFSLILWSVNSHSKEIKYEDLSGLVSSGNGKVLAERDQVIGSQSLTGSFTRSFIPELKVFAGSEYFDSRGLGTHSTDFYGATTRVNIFNGMRDYWEEERRKENVKLLEVEALSVEKRMLLEARKAFLVMYSAQELKSVYEESFSRISEVERKVRGKVKGGVISKSDLTTLSLARLGLKESLRELDRDFELAHVRLKNTLGLDEPAKLVASEDFLIFPKGTGNDGHSADKSLIAKKYKLQASLLEKASRVQGNAIVPSVDLYASYQRQPYSQREILVDENRNELRAGVVASWSLGEAFESRQQAKNLDWSAKAAQKLSEYHRNEYQSHLEALEVRRALLRESVQEVNDEFSLSRNYYGEISGEYIRGVKSTSDLIAAINQIMELHQRKVKLGVGYRLAEAEIDALTGER